jgi:hypothetical protein
MMAGRRLLIGNLIVLGALLAAVMAEAIDAYWARDRQMPAILSLGIHERMFAALLDAVRPTHLRDVTGGQVITAEAAVERLREVSAEYQRRLEAYPVLTSAEMETLP